MNYLEVQGMFGAFMKCHLLTFDYSFNRYVSLSKDFELTITGIRIYNSEETIEVDYNDIVDINVTMENDIEVVYKKVIEVKV